MVKYYILNFNLSGDDKTQNVLQKYSVKICRPLMDTPTIEILSMMTGTFRQKNSESFMLCINSTSKQ